MADRYPERSFPDDDNYDRGGHSGASSNAEPDQERDLSRYDDALYGERDSDSQHAQHDQAYAGDEYAYEDEYSESPEQPKRRGGMITVFAILALAFFGVGGAYAYRTYVGS